MSFIFLERSVMFREFLESMQREWLPCDSPLFAFWKMRHLTLLKSLSLLLTAFSLHMMSITLHFFSAYDPISLHNNHFITSCHLPAYLLVFSGKLLRKTRLVLSVGWSNRNDTTTIRTHGSIPATVRGRKGWLGSLGAQSPMPKETSCNAMQVICIE